MFYFYFLNFFFFLVKGCDLLEYKKTKQFHLVEIGETMYTKH